MERSDEDQLRIGKTHKKRIETETKAKQKRKKAK
jgi:hypothetical protein